MELEVELCCIAVKEKGLNYEVALKEKQIEFELRKREGQTKRDALRINELELHKASASSEGLEFDVNKCICLVPPFCEKDVEFFFFFFV